jgi:hypothetical protein
MGIIVFLIEYFPWKVVYLVYKVCNYWWRTKNDKLEELWQWVVLIPYVTCDYWTNICKLQALVHFNICEYKDKMLRLSTWKLTLFYTGSMIILLKQKE